MWPNATAEAAHAVLSHWFLNLIDALWSIVSLITWSYHLLHLLKQIGESPLCLVNSFLLWLHIFIISSHLFYCVYGSICCAFMCASWYAFILFSLLWIPKFCLKTKVYVNSNIGCNFTLYLLGTTGRRWWQRRSRPFFARPTGRWTKRCELEEKKERSKTRGAKERRTHPEKEGELGGAGRGQRAPPSISLWLNAVLFKRIVHRLANLPAASTAEHDGANVMRVAALPAYVPAANSTRKLHRSLMKDALIHSSLHSLATEWSPIFRATRGSPIGRLNAPNAYFKMKCCIFWR